MHYSGRRALLHLQKVRVVCSATEQSRLSFTKTELFVVEKGRVVCRAEGLRHAEGQSRRAESLVVENGTAEGQSCFS